MILSGSEPVETVQRCINSIASFVDGVYLTITTKDETGLREALSEYNVDYAPDEFTKTVEPENIKWLSNFLGHHPICKHGDKIFQFDEARNHAMAQVPDEYDWILWLDADDIFRGGENLKKVIHHAEKNEIDACYLNYLYQVDIKEGKIEQILIQHLRERIIRNNGSFKWVAPIHETLIEQRQTRKKDYNQCDVVHLSSDERRITGLDRNIKALENNVFRVRGEDPRPTYYLAKAYFDRANVDGDKDYYRHSQVLFSKYLFGTKEYEYRNRSGWAEERAQCWEYLMEIHRQWGEYDEAIKCGMNALIEDERYPSVYISLALTYLMKEEYERAIFWVQTAATIPQPETTLVLNPRDIQARTLEVIYHASLNTSKLDQAWAAAQKLSLMFPDDANMKARYDFCDKLRNERELTKGIISLAKHLEDSGQKANIPSLLSSLPRELENNPFIVKLAQKYRPPREWEDNEIAIYCGPGVTNWDGSTIDNPGESFIGGSEEAVIHMGKELAKLGWKVTVFNDPQVEGDHDGVTYLPYYKFNSSDSFNILVIWRQIGFVDGRYDSKKTYVWCHDVQNNLDYNEDRLSQITKVMVLSPYHRTNVPSVPDEKIMITGNGI